MRMKLDLLNASSKPLFSVGVGNLPETYGENAVKEGCPLTGYRSFSRQAGEPDLTERKHTPTIHIGLLLSQTGDCLNQSVRKKLCVMRVCVINPKAEPREMTLKI